MSVNTPNNSNKAQTKVPFITAKIDRFVNLEDSPVKAIASVTVGNHFTAHGFKVIDGGEKGLAVLNPAVKGTDGKWRDTFHPVSKEARESMNKYILDAYEQAIRLKNGQTQKANAQSEIDAPELSI